MTFQGYPYLQKSSKKRYQELPASGRPSHVSISHLTHELVAARREAVLPVSLLVSLLYSNNLLRRVVCLLARCE